MITATRTGPHATADQFGATSAAAMGQIGKAITGLFVSLGSALGKAQEQQDNLAAVREWSLFEAETNKDLFRSLEDTPPDQIASLPQQFIDRYDQRAADLMTRIPQSQQAKVGQFVARLRSNADVRVSQQSIRRAYDAQSGMIQQTAQDQAAALSDNPGDMSAAVERMIAVARQTQLPHWRQQEEIERGYMTLLQAGRDGYIKRGDPEAAAAFVDKWIKAAPAYGFRTGQPGEMPIKELPSTPGGVPGSAPRFELRPDERDTVIRTIYGEAANEGEAGWQAVAEVIRNRVLTGKWGKTAEDVVLAEGQFEPWMTMQGRQRMASLSPDSQKYQQIAAVVDRVFAGEAPDLTKGATHFFAPVAQRALGRKAPAWAKNMLVEIGGHQFYAPEGSVALPAPGAATAPPGAQFTVAGRVTMPSGRALDWQQFMKQNDAVLERARGARDRQIASDRAALYREIDADMRSLLSGEPENQELTLDRVGKLLSPEEFELWQAKRQAAREYGSVMAGFEAKSEEEQVRAVEVLKPQDANAIDYSYRTALYADAQRRLNSADAMREREMRRDAQRMYRDMRSRLGEAKLTRAELDDNRDLLSERQYDQLNRALEVQEQARDTPEALRDLAINADMMDEDDFDRRAGAYLRRGRITPGTYRELAELNERGGSPERTAVRQAMAGVEFLSPAAQRMVQDHMIEVLRRFDAADHPERTPEERAALMQKVINDGLATFPHQRLRQVIGLSRYFAAKDVQKVTPQELVTATQRLAAEAQAGAIRGTELAQEVARLSDWETLFAMQSAPRRQGVNMPKPAAQPQQTPAQEVDRRFYGMPPPHEMLSDPAKMAEGMRRILPEDSPEVLEGREHIR
jgi:hypothetical protein